MRRKNGIYYGACAVFLASAVLTGGCAANGVDEEKSAQAEEALEEGDYQTAQQLFEQALPDGESGITAVTVYRGLGLAYLGLGQYDKAETAFEAALECTDDRMPETVQDVRLYLATAQYRQEEYEEVIDTCSALLDDSENSSADAYFLRGASYLHEGETDEAADDFDASVELEPENYDRYLDIYACYDSENLSGAGSEYLQSALNIKGEDTEHKYNRGRIYYYLENYEKAQEELVGPAEEGYEPAMYLIGQVYLALDDCSHAEAVYQQLLQNTGEKAEIYNGLARCALQSGDYDTALSYISQGLALDGTEGKQALYFNEIVAYEKKLDFAAAREKAKAYVENYPADEEGQKEYTFLASRT